LPLLLAFYSRVFGKTFQTVYPDQVGMQRNHVIVTKIHQSSDHLVGSESMFLSPAYELGNGDTIFKAFALGAVQLVDELKYLFIRRCCPNWVKGFTPVMYPVTVHDFSSLVIFHMLPLLLEI
jgi:hypothetical protein